MAKDKRGGQNANVGSTTTNAGGAFSVNNYGTMTDQDAQDLRDTEDSKYDGSVTSAIKLYIAGANQNSAMANWDGNGHSLSQTLNYCLDNNIPFDQAPIPMSDKNRARKIADLKYVDKYLQKGMHPIGKNTTLYRGAHDDIIKSLGISNYQQYDGATLSKLLVGTKGKLTSNMSTSYDKKKSPFLNGALSGGREVLINVHADASAKMVFGKKDQAENVLGKGNNFEVVGVKYTGNMAYPRSKGAMKQIELDIRVW